MKTLFALLALFITGSAACAADEKPIVLVTLSPFKVFLEQIVGDKVEVEVLVPPASDPHTYNPTPRQVERVGRAEIWFRMGETAERPVLNAMGKKLPSVDLRKNLNMITDPAARCPCCGAEDLHIWMSARNAQVISRTMADTMISLHPEWSEEIEANLAEWEETLQALDREIEEILVKRCSQMLLASHPDFAYFARDYGLEQVTIEVEGKEPTPQQLMRTMERAKAAGVHVVIVEPQRSRRGADRLSKELQIPVVVIDPFGDDYTGTLRHLAQVLSC